MCGMIEMMTNQLSLSRDSAVVGENHTCAVAVTYYPDESNVSNIRVLASQFDCVYVIDNTPNEIADVSLAPLNTLPNVVVVLNRKNLGIATALNIGIIDAMNSGCSWIATFDQDSRITEGYLQSMIATYLAQRRLNKDQIGMVFPVYRDFQTGIELPVSVSSEGYARICITSGALCPVTTFQVVGLMDEALFIDYVDIDFCLRLNKARKKILQCKSAILLHSLGRITPKSLLGVSCLVTNHPPRRHYYISRNGAIIMRRYAIHEPAWFIGELIRFAKSIAKMLFFEEQKMQKLRYIIRGVRDAALNRRGEGIDLIL